MKSNLKKSEFLNWFRQEVSSVLEKGERQEIMLRLLEHEGISRLDWAIAQYVELDKKVWEAYTQDLRKHKPIQYILGYEYFAGEKFIVSEAVLIPRPETEELVNWIIAENKRAEQLSIVEIGTGSGCISIALKKGLPQARILATDISAEALAIARQNAQQLDSKVEFKQDDILNTNIKDVYYDIIVSNPPYIPLEEASSMDKRVKDFEPHCALFTEKKNPMQFYQAIIEFAKLRLQPTGSLFFEIHEDYASQLQLLAKKFDMQPEVRKDIYGKERMICLRFC